MSVLPLLSLSLFSAAANPYATLTSDGPGNIHAVVIDEAKDRFLFVGAAGREGGWLTGLGAVNVKKTGAIDRGWGSAGLASWLPADDDGVHNTARASDAVDDGAHGVIMVGTALDEWGTSAVCVAARLDADGALVWHRFIDLGGFLCTASAVARDGRGGVIVVGAAGIFSPGTWDAYALRLRESDGSVDTSFGSGGARFLDMGCGGRPTDDFGTAVAVQPDGNIVVGGTIQQYAGGTTCGLDREVEAFRLKPDGSLDPSFGVRGRFSVDLGADERVAKVRLRPTGQILLAGTASYAISDGDFATLLFVQLTPGGTLDTAFGTAGSSKIEVVKAGRSELRDARIAADGKIVAALAGFTAHRGTLSDAVVARVTANGRALDVGFGPLGGFTNLHIGAGTSEAAANAVVIDSAGALIVGGQHRPSTGGQPMMFAAKLEPGGALSTTFSGP